MQWIVLAAAAAAISNALPVDENTQGLVKRDTTTSQLATFDDLNNPTTGQSPGIYKGLNYSSLVLENDVDPDGKKIITAQSEPYYLEGAATYGRGVVTDGTTTKSFDLGSFYFGCFDGRSRVANACNFTVTGLVIDNGRHQGPLPFTYTPELNSDFSAPMQKVQLGWFGLTAFYVDVIADQATLARLYQTIDSVQYTTHQ